MENKDYENTNRVWKNILFGFYLFMICFLLANLEIQILYSYVIIAVVWDFQWFVMNPYFGMEKYKPENIWWFKNWVFSFPVDYFIGIAVSLVLFLIPVFIKRIRLKERFYEWLIIT